MTLLDATVYVRFDNGLERAETCGTRVSPFIYHLFTIRFEFPLSTEVCVDSSSFAPG